MYKSIRKKVPFVLKRLYIINCVAKKKKSVVFHFLYDPVRDVVYIVLCILQNHYLLLRKSFRLVGHLLRKRQFKDAS